MNAGKNHTKARAQAQANADRSQSPRWLHQYGGSWWISTTPTADAERVDPATTKSRHHATKKSPGVRAVGGPYAVYFEKAGGEPVKTSATTKRQAILLACATSKMTGGYVTVNHKGIEVAACYGGAVVEGKRHHATKKSPAQLQREIDEALAKSGKASSKAPATNIVPSASQARFQIQTRAPGGEWEIHSGVSAIKLARQWARETAARGRETRLVDRRSDKAIGF